MSKEIYIDVNNNETRVAILENDRLVELYIENESISKTVGNIYVGKVSRVLPGMQAAFIDIGTGKNAFLYIRDAILESEYTAKGGLKISNVLKVGQDIIVQVIKEAIGTKGARVTTHLTLPGRHLILLPLGDYIGISRRIYDEELKEKLKREAMKVKPDNMGLIIRTIASSEYSYDFLDDVKFLTNLWNEILKKTEKGSVPRCVYKDMSAVLRTVRDCFSADVDKLTINNKEGYYSILEFLELMSPELKPKVHYASDCINLFDKYDIEYSIEQALNKKVWLKCGGYLIIEETEALTVIDVNTGKFIGKNNLEDTILKTNLEAVKEIAIQLRLRDIGGIVIVDFIDMKEETHQNMLIEAMKEELKKDRTKTTVVGMTGLGLLEMTRKKIRRKLSFVLQDVCTNCKGTGKIAKKDKN